MRGRLDTIKGGVAYGWAHEAGLAAPVTIEILVDGKSVGTCLANGHRPDLESAGIGDGHAAFQLRLPLEVQDAQQHLIEALDAESRQHLDGSPVAMELPRALTEAEFDRQAPWLDADDHTFALAMAERLRSGAVSKDEAQRLTEFRNEGYAVLQAAVPHALIDKLLADVETSWTTLPALQVVAAGSPLPKGIREIPQPPGFRKTSFRYLDFHNVSEAAAEIMCMPAVLRFIELYLGQPLAGMQTLLFENGTQQSAHQDFPYVHSQWPASMAGAWVALEDALPDAGPLFYYPRSHRLVRKYTFEDGSLLAQGDGPHVRRYEQYLESECERLGLQKLVFLPKKGDVLIWHSALVHGGTSRLNPVLSRKSLVSHFTPQAAYETDRRHSGLPPLPIVRNGCRYYASQASGHVEMAMRLR